VFSLPIKGKAYLSYLQLFLLGPPLIKQDAELVDLRLRKAIALLSYLTITKGEYSRDELATLFWPDSSQSSARASLRRTLYLVNKAFGQEVISSGIDTLKLASQLEIWIDVDKFKQYLYECTEDGELSYKINTHCLSYLEQAVELYKGDFLAGFSLPDSPQFDEWQFFEAENLRKLMGTALQQLVLAYESQGDSARSIQYARDWLALDSMHEPAHRLLMRLYQKNGQHAAAVRQYQECVRILEQELGLSPQSETTELYQQIRLERQKGLPLRGKVRPEVKFVASGDVHIAYTELGAGPMDIILVCGYISHMEQLWELPEIGDFFGELASFSRVILFDRRGVGLSDRVGYQPTMEDTLDDILAVMRDAGSEHAVLFGYLEGGPNSILFTATYPELVSGLILYGTCAKWTRSEDYPWAITREQYDRWLQHISENWGEALNLKTYAPSFAHQTGLQDWWAKTMRLSSSPGGIKAVLEVMRDIDVRHILPSIHTPTLILHRKGDRSIRIGAGRYLADHIPGARYVELEGDDHWFFLGDTQPILYEMRTFIQNMGSPVVPERVLATIMMVESLDLKQIDGEGSPAAVNFTSALQQEIGRFQGRQISWHQARFTAIFDGPSRAIHCSKAIIESAHQQGVRLRAGLHTGECQFSSGELGGPAPQITENILNSARADEILISSTLKDLVVGSGFQFVERDEISVAGIPDRWGTYSLSAL
jgi:DNA-binding SARP family transcriptional activator/class 3 adenylate cyclase